MNGYLPSQPEAQTFFVVHDYFSVGMHVSIIKRCANFRNLTVLLNNSSSLNLAQFLNCVIII